MISQGGIAELRSVGLSAGGQKEKPAPQTRAGQHPGDLGGDPLRGIGEMKQFGDCCVHCGLRPRHRECREGPLGELPTCLPLEEPAETAGLSCPPGWLSCPPSLLSLPSSTQSPIPQATESGLLRGDTWAQKSDLAMPPAHQAEGLHYVPCKVALQNHMVLSLLSSSAAPTLP